MREPPRILEEHPKSHALWTKLVDWTVIVYPFLEVEVALSFGALG